MPNVILPTFHPGQVAAYNLVDKDGNFPRRKVIRCGRRWGKTDYCKTVACDGAVKGEPIGWFTPDYKRQTEAYNEIADILDPVRKRSSKVEGVYRTTTGGRIDFWTLEDANAGRSRKYKKVIIDEAAFTKPNMMEIWERSIEPTLLDMRGYALVASNTNGVKPDNFLWRICNEPKFGFTEYHAPTHQNPYMPTDELVRLEAASHPLVWRQEDLAEFVDWSGVQFFDLQKFLVEGAPVEYPARCDAIFATIDTAIKAGKEHDGTSVVYWAYSRHTSHPLVILDWDAIQIEGSLLEQWLPQVLMHCEHLAKVCSARSGSIGAFIEDKASGTILLQQAARKNPPLKARAIDSKLVSLGKDARAISVSGYCYQGKVKLSRIAYEKTITYKDQHANHLMQQFFGYRVGIENIDDDLFDATCYGIAISLGNIGGF